MRPDMHTELTSKPIAAPGISIIEILLCFAKLGLIMVPFVMTLGTTTQAARGLYIQSTQSILMNSLKAEISPASPTYVSDFTDNSTNSLTDMGQTLGYRRVVNATTANATNSMKRTTLFYLYTNATDASNSPRYKSSLISYPKIFRMRFGDTRDVIDSLNRYWYSDENGSLVYSSTNEVPGWDVSYPVTYTSNDIVNTTGNNDKLFQGETDAGTLNYAMDVENGFYTVKIFFCETYAAINSTSNLRRMNIYMEGSKMNPDGPYSPYESTGATNRAEIKMYDTEVWDGVLNITIANDSSSNDPNANPRAIEIIKRTMQ